MANTAPSAGMSGAAIDVGAVPLCARYQGSFPRPVSD
jgi:hypothetical protein